jgi:hypothetical protein
MSLLRTRRIQLLSLALGAAVFATSSPLGAGASSRATVTSVITAAKAAMLKKVSVHVVVSSTSGTKLSTVVVDIGSRGGQETVTSGAKTVTITITPKYAYLSGSATGLTQVMGLTSAQQMKIGFKAMAMKSGTPQYTNLKSNLTTPVFASMLPVVKGTSLMTIGSGSSKQYVLSWKTAATSTSTATSTVMTFSSGALTLPVTEKITSPKGVGITTYSKWGERVIPVVPTSTVTYKSVFG